MGWRVKERKNEETNEEGRRRRRKKDLGKRHILTRYIPSLLSSSTILGPHFATLSFQKFPLTLFLHYLVTSLFYSIVHTFSRYLPSCASLSPYFTSLSFIHSVARCLPSLSIFPPYFTTLSFLPPSFSPHTSPQLHFSLLPSITFLVCPPCSLTFQLRHPFVVSTRRYNYTPLPPLLLPSPSL